MTIIVQGFLGPLLVTQGYAPGSSFVIYVDPTQVTVIDTPSAPADIDPTQVTVIQ
jgi:hypothetical protein